MVARVLVSVVVMLVLAVAVGSIIQPGRTQSRDKATQVVSSPPQTVVFEVRIKDANEPKFIGTWKYGKVNYTFQTDTSVIRSKENGQKAEGFWKLLPDGKLRVMFPVDPEGTWQAEWAVTEGRHLLLTQRLRPVAPTENVIGNKWNLRCISGKGANLYGTWETQDKKERYTFLTYGVMKSRINGVNYEGTWRYWGLQLEYQPFGTNGGTYRADSCIDNGLRLINHEKVNDPKPLNDLDLEAVDD